jgi:transposase-like protein
MPDSTDASAGSKRDPNRDTRRQVLAMYRAGVPVRRIAYALDVSITRVYQQLERLRELGELERPA